MTMTGPCVSVVIVNWNGGELLRSCVRSVFAQSYRPLEVILVDNGSSDGSAAAIRADFPSIIPLALETNIGFAAGSNRGVEAATGAYVVLLNNDTEVEEGWIPGLLAIAEDGRVGAVTSRVVTEGQPAAWYEMNGTLNYLGYNIMRAFADLSLVFFAGGASLMFHRERTGRPFPDDYFLYQEDVYLSWRLRLEGKEIRMAQASVVRHRGSASTRKQPGRLVTYYQERNRLLNLLLFYEGGTILRLLPYLMADAVAKVVLSLAGRKSTLGILRAYAWCLTHPAWIGRERSAIQMRRSVRDREILPLLSPDVVDAGTRFARALNGLSAMYARLTGLSPVPDTPPGGKMRGGSHS
jgi:GT2 family glycosyltransferase